MDMPDRQNTGLSSNGRLSDAGNVTFRTLTIDEVAVDEWAGKASFIPVGDNGRAVFSDRIRGFLVLIVQMTLVFSIIRDRIVKMGIDIDAFLNRSIERFRVQQIGYLTATQVPFIVLENGLVFYGLPVRKGEISARLVSGAATVLNDIDFRYFQNGRQYKQHSYYQYKPGDVVVELGAYLGFYSMYAAKQVGPTGKVIAVEMVPQNFAVMQKNLSSNYPETTIAINRGIHNRRGIQTAYLGRNQIAGFRKDVVARFSNSFSKVTVEMDTVDNILEEYAVTHVDLMIVQVNGNEIDALQGMQRSLHTIDNFAIAAPYDSQGVNHVAHISDHLNKNGFAVMSNSGWVFAARRQPALKATVL